MTDIHLIMDVETIGQSVFKSPLVNCAYMLFDMDRFLSNNPYTFEEIIQEARFDKLDVTYQKINHGAVIKKKDIEWWESQGPIAAKTIYPSKRDVEPDVYLNNLVEYIKTSKHPINKWWSRSNAFDPIFLQKMVEFSEVYDMDMFNKILPFWNVRDTRTFIDTRFDFKVKFNSFCPMEDEAEWKKVYTPHNSVHDIASDILRMQRIQRAYNEAD